MIQTVFFDLDGTIIDTEKAATQAIVDCFARWGVHVVEEDASMITGRTWDSALRALMGKYQLPLTRDEAMDEVLERYRQGLLEELITVPGSVQAVESLAEKYPLALVSGSHRSEILWSLGKLGIRNHFKVIYGAEDYPRSKPAPDGYLKALDTLKAKPDSTLVFEDSYAGIRSGRDAGLWVVAITGTNHFSENQAEAHLHIPDLTSVNSAWMGKLKLTKK